MGSLKNLEPPASAPAKSFGGLLIFAGIAFIPILWVICSACVLTWVLGMWAAEKIAGVKAATSKRDTVN